MAEYLLRYFSNLKKFFQHQIFILPLEFQNLFQHQIFCIDLSHFYELNLSISKCTQTKNLKNTDHNKYMEEINTYF